MPMVEKPHTAVVYAIGKKKTGVHVQGSERTEGATITGQLTVKTQSYAFEKYGIETTRPALWMCDVADAASFKAGDELLVGGVTWNVLTEPQTHDADDETSHATALLNRSEH